MKARAPSPPAPVKYACGKCERMFEEAEMVQPAGGAAMVCRECAAFLQLPVAAHAAPVPAPSPAPPKPAAEPATCQVCGQSIGMLDNVVPGILERIHVECAAAERHRAEKARRDEAERDIRAKLAAGDNGPLLDELRAGRAAAEATRDAARSIRAWVIFFGVLVLIGLFVGVIWALAKAA